MRNNNGKKSNKLKQSLLHTIRKTFEKQQDKTLSHKEVCDLVDAREGALRTLVFSVLKDLASEGFLKAMSYDTFKMNSQEKLILEGSISVAAKGFGFVTVATEKADVFISPNHIGQALNGDRVKIQVLKYGKSRIEGQVIEVIERERTQFVGTIQMHEKFAFLIPDNIKMNTDIYIPKEKLNGAKDKEKALVKITVWPKTAGNPYGEVIEVLGKTGSNDTEMISILCNNGIDYKFPPEVLTEAESVGMELDPEEIKNRRDFRNTTTITIDPVDARDFDDALSFRKLENGHFEIGVHIADVSHYVTPGSAMDVEH